MSLWCALSQTRYGESIKETFYECKEKFLE
jgi:hypothetical protein